ncbi:hypothetical protein U9M48_038534, partial [Paspalum notatum var. saurae]
MAGPSLETLLPSFNYPYSDVEQQAGKKELSKKHEINKRRAISSSAYHSNSGNIHVGVRPTNIKEKPLLELSRLVGQFWKHSQASSMISMARKYSLHPPEIIGQNYVLETVSLSKTTRILDLEGLSHDLKWTTNTSSCDSHVAPSDIPMEKLAEHTGLIELSCKGESSAENQIQGKLLSDWQAEVEYRMVMEDVTEMK